MMRRLFWRLFPHRHILGRGQISRAGVLIRFQCGRCRKVFVANRETGGCVADRPIFDAYFEDVV